MKRIVVFINTTQTTKVVNEMLEWVSSGADPAEAVRGTALAEPDLERYTIRLPGESFAVSGTKRCTMRGLGIQRSSPRA
jgi:hypothetical protein